MLGNKDLNNMIGTMLQTNLELEVFYALYWRKVRSHGAMREH